MSVEPLSGSLAHFCGRRLVQMKLASLIASTTIFFTGSLAMASQHEEASSTQHVVVIGASYAASWHIERLAGRVVVNMGIDGNQSFEMAERFDRDVMASSPSVVVIWGFINDIFRSDLANIPSSKIRIQESYRDMIDVAQSNGVEVILATEVSIREPSGFMNAVAGIVGRMLGKTSYQDTINKHVSDVNQWLRVYAESKAITVLDFEALLADTDGQRKAKFAVSDGSHLTAAAYEAMSIYTRETLLDAEVSVVEVD